MALLGFPLAAGVSVAGEPESCAGSLLTVEDPHVPAPRGLQTVCRDCRALLCPQPRSRRHLPNLSARERAQAVPASRHRPQSLIAEAPTHRRRHAAGGRSLRIWLYLRAQDAHWRRSGRSDSPHRLGGWRNRLRRVMLRREVKPSHQQLFNGVIGWGRLGTDIAILVLTGSLS